MSQVFRITHAEEGETRIVELEVGGGAELLANIAVAMDRTGEGMPPPVGSVTTVERVR